MESAVSGAMEQQQATAYSDKCKEFVIDFKKAKDEFGTIIVNSKTLEGLISVKILGVTMVGRSGR